MGKHLHTCQTRVRGRGIGQKGGGACEQKGGSNSRTAQRSSRKSDARRVGRRQQHTRAASDPSGRAAPKRERRGEEGWARGDANPLLHHPMDARAMPTFPAPSYACCKLCYRFEYASDASARERHRAKGGWRVRAEVGGSRTEREVNFLIH